MTIIHLVGRTAYIRYSNPPINALSLAVRQAILDALESARADPRVDVIVLTGSGAFFSGGSDIAEFGDGNAEPSLHTVISAIEDFPKPIVALVNGMALGGGLELALGCHWRVAVPSARFGLPEVQLGLIPGAGGTQRLPRLIGLAEAAEMILTGQPIGVERALKVGLVDEIIDGNEMTYRPAGRQLTVRPTRLLPTPPAVADFDSARCLRRRKRQTAPQRAWQSLKNSESLPFAKALAEEDRLFRECVADPQSKALTHLFFAERSAVKGLASRGPAREVNSVGVIGGGTMGSSIATALISAGIAVNIVDQSKDICADAPLKIKRNIAQLQTRSDIDIELAARALEVSRFSTELTTVSNADIIIEAVFEQIDLKRSVFAALDKIAHPNAILATNTSTLDINVIAGVTRRPQAIIGMHFFSPAHIMRLVEVVKAEKTAPEVLASVLKLAKRIGKAPVIAQNADGFIVNRILGQYTREAHFLVEEGADIEQVDAVVEGAGFAMGPFRMLDLAGLDIDWDIRKSKGAPSGRYPYLADRLCELGRLGQKTGKGYYRYKGRVPESDTEVDSVIAAMSQERAVGRLPVTDELIFVRLMLTLVNAGAEVLENGIARRAGDIDLAFVLGCGFPAWRGGPMYWAEHEFGLERTLSMLRQLRRDQDERFEPNTTLIRAAAAGGWDRV